MKPEMNNDELHGNEYVEIINEYHNMKLLRDCTRGAIIREIGIIDKLPDNIHFYLESIGYINFSLSSFLRAINKIENIKIKLEKGDEQNK